jgi:hypothetical protein
MRTFRKLGFDISYLALLTKEQVKPLSRWEGRFSRRQIKALRHLGLRTETVDRKLFNGQTKPELIFSTSSRYLDLYRRKYHRRPIAKDQRTVKTEGFLFGYPSCCVHNFARNGYTRNEFQGRGQDILFHWACPGCRATPELLPYYQTAHDRCREMLAAQRPSGSRLLRASLPAAALATIMALTPGRARADDPHWYSPSAIDTSGDFLDENEELLLGAVWGGFPGGLPNGPQEAPDFADLIASLPRAPANNCCYLEEVAMDGVENCMVCGQEMTMGGWLLHNPMRGDTLFLSNMALHYMEHGSFSFDGTTNAGRVEIAHLKSILAHYDTDHYAIETANDDDEDGLRDDHESHFGTQAGDADSDDDQLVDGAWVAEHFIEVLSQLPLLDSPGSPAPDDTPYIYYDIAYGIESCDICGMVINMGNAVITNPLTDTSMTFPLIGLHYLAHGRFAYGGGTHSGEINPVELAHVLDTSTWTSPSPHRPWEYELSLRNYPNPFNAGTQIAFHLPKAGRATLSIYNINGQLVKMLHDEVLEAGGHVIRWDGSNDWGVLAASGIYFCRLEHGGRVKATKLLLVK